MRRWQKRRANFFRPCARFFKGVRIFRAAIIAARDMNGSHIAAAPIIGLRRAFIVHSNEKAHPILKASENAL